MAGKKSNGSAVWNGTIREGKGTISTDSGVLDDVQYSFSTRFEEGKGTNPEELIAAAHAACFSMAFAGALGSKGYTPQRIATSAVCTVERKEQGFRITTIKLNTKASVPDIDEATFKDIAHEAERGCPVSNALAGVDITLEASLNS